MRSTGTYVTTSTLGEPVRAFVPYRVPPSRPALTPHCYEAGTRAAELALARLSGVSGLVPSVDWLLYSAIRKEALLTSQIEGIQATFTDPVDEEAGLAVANTDDVEEVSNCLRAYRLVRDNLHKPRGLPVSVRLPCNAHRVLMTGARGSAKQPGELRRSQNRVGGTRPGNAVFVPPPPQRLAELLAQLERFIHVANPNLPALVRVALVHAKFQTIHPFMDGNGRIGRLLIAALMEQWGLLPQPLMYLSGTLKKHQREYYATEAERAIVDIASLVTADRRRLLAAPRVGAMGMRLLELLPVMPRFTIEQARQKLVTTFRTATAAVKLLENLGIVAELTGQKKNRSFSCGAYVELPAR